MNINKMYREGFTVAEIACIVGRSVESVKRQLVLSGVVFSK